MFSVINWVTAVMGKTSYLVSHPKALWKERREEARARAWAREMTKKAE